MNRVQQLSRQYGQKETAEMVVGVKEEDVQYLLTADDVVLDMKLWKSVSLFYLIH